MDETTFMYVEIVLAVLAVVVFAFAVTVLTRSGDLTDCIPNWRL